MHLVPLLLLRQPLGDLRTFDDDVINSWWRHFDRAGHFWTRGYGDFQFSDVRFFRIFRIF